MNTKERKLEAIKRNNPRYLDLFTRVYAGEATKGECIKANCLACNGWSPSAVRECTADSCPMHGIRPFQTDDETEPDTRTPEEVAAAKSKMALMRSKWGVQTAEIGKK